VRASGCVVDELALGVAQGVPVGIAAPVTHGAVVGVTEPATGRGAPAGRFVLSRLVAQGAAVGPSPRAAAQGAVVDGNAPVGPAQGTGADVADSGGAARERGFSGGSPRAFGSLEVFGTSSLSFGSQRTKPPSGRCCTTTRFPSTSPSHIFTRPLCTFAQRGTPVAMACSCAECSENGPDLYCRMRAMWVKKRLFGG
jgi:hypothetical protein